MTTSTLAVLPAPLHYQNLQRLKNEGLKHTQSYETVVPLDIAAKEELQCWGQHLQMLNGKPVAMMDPDMFIETNGLGGTLCRHPDWWTMVGRRAHDAYKLCGATRRSICSKNPWESKQGYPHSTQNGQYNRDIIHQQNEGNTFSHACKDGMQPLAMVPRKGNVLSAEHLPGSQNMIADRESDIPLSGRVAKMQQCVPKYSNPTRSVPSRPFCYTFKPPTPPVRELATRHICLDKPERLCLSLVGTRQMPTESETGAKYPDRRSHGLASTGVVPPPPGTGSPASSVAPKLPTPPQKTFGQLHSLLKMGQLQLATWKVLGITTWQTEFQAGFPDSSLLERVKAQTLPTNQPGKIG